MSASKGFSKIGMVLPKMGFSIMRKSILIVGILNSGNYFLKNNNLGNGKTVSQHWETSVFLFCGFLFKNSG
jgi:hypothetical protein